MSDWDWDIIYASLAYEKSKNYIFTENTDWFHGVIKQRFKKHVIVPQGIVKILEIGSYEGRSTVWLIENYLAHPESTILVIDPYLKSDTTTNVHDNTYENFKHNINQTGKEKQMTFFKNKSEDILPILLFQKRTFGIIFVDGSHVRQDVLTDLILSWKLLENNGYLIVDDYDSGDVEIKKCVNFWLEGLDKDAYKVLHNTYQIIIRKLK